MPTRVRSHAKINLGLSIGAPRADGFHSLVTLYQTLEVHDLVTVTARPAPQTSITLTSNHRFVPTDNRNTAWKMVDLTLRALNQHATVSIHIEKRLPVQGGLGAGSANAVAALIGLEAELRSYPQSPAAASFIDPRWPSQRLLLAAEVGSDVPLFLIGGAVLGIDRGQQVLPLPDLPPTHCVLAIPSLGVPTPQAFRDWDALCRQESLTPEESESKLKELSRVYAAAFTGEQVWTGSSGVLAQEQSNRGEDLAGPQVSALVRTGIVNDFERVVFPQYPLLSEIKRILAAPGHPEEALYASLSGSGSALFGLYRDQRDAEASRDRLRAAGVESLITLTLPRSAYWRDMTQQ
jgi:4-diphosphocytidyl-2-C-methyl-D-erythritol kinase